MHVIVTYKYEKDRMKNSREKVETPFFPSLPYLLPWKLAVGSGRISNSSKLSCMLSLPASLKRIQSRKAEKKWRHHFSHYKPMGIFSDAQGQLTPQSVVQSCLNLIELVPALMHVIIACKYEKDRMKNSREKVETPFSPL